jgi:hypothetical protein
MPLISVTRLRIRSARFLPGFFVYAFRSTRQARRTPGNLGAAVFNDSLHTFWTKTAWQDEAAMRAFMRSGPHTLAMPKLAHWCDEASVVHWSQDTAELPAWPEAHRRMQAEGRPSRVRHPSPAHEAFRIAPPR